MKKLTISLVAVLLALTSCQSRIPEFSAESSTVSASEATPAGNFEDPFPVSSLTGKSYEELLADPIKALTAGSVTGLRLIPYKALGSANGLLPALMLDAVCVDGNQTGRLVAFSKELTGEDGFEALIGGTI